MSRIRRPLLRLFLSGLLAATAGPAPAENAPAAATAFENECAMLGKLIEQEVGTKDAGLLGEFFDLDTLLDRALAGLKCSPDLETRLRASFKDGFDATFRKQLTGAASFKLLRVHPAGQQTRALFRLIQEDGGPNYLDMICERARDGGVKIVDVHLLAVGHTLSDTARRTFLLALAEAQGGSVEGASGAEGDVIRHRAEIQNFNRLAAHNETKPAFAAYAKLPPALQKDRLVLSTRLKLASQFNVAEHKAAIDLWRATYPKDAAIDLISFDGHVLKKQHEEALATLDRLDKALGGDPYLDVLRATQYFPMGEPGQARRLADKAVQREPGLARVADGVLASVAPPDPLRLQGIFFSKANPSAIVNGKTVFLNDMVGRFQVKSIERDSVTLESPSGQTRVLELKAPKGP